MYDCRSRGIMIIVSLLVTSHISHVAHYRVFNFSIYTLFHSQHQYVPE